MTITILAITLGGCIILGIVSVKLDQVKIKKNIKYVNKFLSYIEEYYKGNTEPQICNYIIGNYKVVSKIIGEKIYKDSICNFGTALSYCNPIEHNLYYRIYNETIEFTVEKDIEYKHLYKKYINPFELFYRGVELLTNLMFGYIIRKFNPKFNPNESTIWKVLNCIIAILSCIVSILSFFTF